MLGYSTIFMARCESEVEAVKKKMWTELEGAYSKLFRLKDNGSSDTMFWSWGLSKFYDTLSPDLGLSPRLECSDDGVNILFGFEEARNVFQKFRKFDLSSPDKNCTLSNSRFDAIMTVVWVSFQNKLNSNASVHNRS